jgi:hypothetical protein
LRGGQRKRCKIFEGRSTVALFVASPDLDARIALIVCSCKDGWIFDDKYTLTDGIGNQKHAELGAGLKLETAGG